MDHELVARVYGAASEIIRGLCTPLRQGLERLGVGTHQFPRKLEELVGTILFTPLDQEPLARLTIQGVADPRHAMLLDMFVGLGVEKDTAKRYADSLETIRGQFDDQGNRVSTNTGLWADSRHWKAALSQWQYVIHARARKTLDTLKDIERDASQPFEGKANDVEEGVEQLVDLMKRFPDLSDHIYRQAGLTNISSFPPEAAPGKTPNADEQRLQALIQEELDDDWWSGIFWTAGLAIVAIGLTVLTAGTLGAVAAAVVGAGLGTASGGVMVYNRAAAVEEGRVAVQIGAMDPATLEHLQRELNGAWGMLAVDVVTGGVLGRFGGTRVVSQILRGTAISATGGGVRTAMDPNVWDSEDRVGLILQGAVVGGVVGGAGSAAGGGLAAVFRPGSKVQVALDKLGGALRPGRRVRISGDPNSPGVTGTVTRADSAGGVVHVQVDGGPTVGVRVEKVVHLWLALRKNPQLGTQAVSRESALLQKFPVASRNHWRNRSTNGPYTQQMSLAVDTLIERIENGTVKNFDDALRLMGAQTWKVNRRISRGDMGGIYGIPGKLRTPDGRANNAMTGVDPAYRPAALNRLQNGGMVAQENGMDLTAIFAPNGNAAWYHTAASTHPQIKARLNVLWNEIMQETRHPQVTAKIAEFHYYFAHMMPYERGSAGAGDAITKALFEMKGFRVGAWKEGIAVDREALVLPLRDFVRNYPAYFE